MLSPRDKIFLKDYADLAAKNHLYAALALQQALVSPHEHVGRLEVSSAIHALELASSEQKVSEAGRFQAICQAKIFAEMVAAFEDFGALCHAIAARGEREIMLGYLRCSVGQVDRFFRRVLNAPSPTLEELLLLPARADVFASAPKDLGAILSDSYNELSEILAGAAQHYATMPDRTHAITLSLPGADWREHINIFVEAVPAGRKAPSSAVMHRRVFEKIKHRFLVLTEIGDYAKISGDPEFHGVSYPRTQEALENMILHLDSMTRFARDLPYMLLIMDKHGLL